MKRVARHYLTLFVVGVGIMIVTQCAGTAPPDKPASCTTDKSSLIIVDTFHLSPTKLASPVGLTYDHYDHLFAAGTATDASNLKHWIVRRSDDLGLTWTTVDDFSLDAAHDSQAMAISTDLNETIIVAGTSIDAAGNSHWIVRELTPGQFVWETMDDIGGLNAFTNATARAIAYDPVGYVYVSGSVATGGVDQWFVRRSADGGNTWVDSDNYANANSIYSTAIASDSQANMYAVGVSRPTATNRWLVRKSVDHGLNWTNVDNFLSNANNTKPTVVKIGPKDEVYVAGVESGVTGTWIVRKSTNMGLTWATTDTFGVNNPAAGPTGGMLNTMGKLSLAGTTYHTGLSKFLGVLRFTLDGTSWANDSAVPRDGTSTTAFSSIISDIAGNVYLMGYSTAAGNPNDWIVQKLDCKTP